MISPPVAPATLAPSARSASKVEALVDERSWKTTWPPMAPAVEPPRAVMSTARANCPLPTLTPELWVNRIVPPVLPASAKKIRRPMPVPGVSKARMPSPESASCAPPPSTCVTNNDESPLKVSELKERARSNTLLVRGGAPLNSRSSPSAGAPGGDPLSASRQKPDVPWPVHDTGAAWASPQDAGPRASVALAASANAVRTNRGVVFIARVRRVETQRALRRRRPWPSKSTVRSARPSLGASRTPATARSSRPTPRPARPVLAPSTSA